MNWLKRKDSHTKWIIHFCTLRIAKNCQTKKKHCFAYKIVKLLVICFFFNQFLIKSNLNVLQLHNLPWNNLNWSFWHFVAPFWRSYNCWICILTYMHIILCHRGIIILCPCALFKHRGTNDVDFFFLKTF